ncbi:MAG TPA: hypothetical protein VHR40_12840 [Thermoleophilaceae bacterium]|jgi:hypothetical protein|nr:hypothetical protein [Thermoleophilaceae bacterium]
MRRIDQIALGVAIALLALGPLALTLARADSYKSTAVLSLNPDNPGARYLPNPSKFLSDPLKVKDLQRAVAKDVDWFNTPRDLPDHVHVVDQGDGKFGVAAEGPGADEAQALATSAARRLRDAAEAGAAFTQPLQLKTIDSALKKKDLPASFRKELRKRRAAIETSVRERQDIYASAPAAATLPTERIGDRVLAALPGKRSFRPNPAWAAFAGIALAGALALWALVLTGRRPEGSGTTTG